MWRKIWRIMEEIGEDFKIDWLPGHSSWLHVLEGKLTPHQHVGNDMADKAAKEARAWAEGTAPNGAYAGQAKRARGWYRWALDFVTAWPFEGGGTSKEEEETGQRTREHSVRHMSSNIRHEIWRIEGALRCRRCAREFGQGDLQAGHSYETCKGTAAGRALAALTGNINYMWADFALPAIRLIKQGAVIVKATKVPEVSVDWNQLDGFTATAEGRHALQGCLGEEAWQELRRRERERQARPKRAREGGGESVEGRQERGSQGEGQWQDGGAGMSSPAQLLVQEAASTRNVRRRVAGKQPGPGLAGSGGPTLGTQGSEGQPPGGKGAEGEEEEVLGGLAREELRGRRRRLVD